MGAFYSGRVIDLSLAALSLDHVAIATPDLELGSAPYLALGLTPEGPDEEVPEQGVRVRVFAVGTALIELLSPSGPDGPVAAFLTRRGPGLHHLAFRVDHLEVRLAQLKEAGAQLIDAAPRPGRAGTRVAFVHPAWAGGTLIELVEHP